MTLTMRLLMTHLLVQMLLYEHDEVDYLFVWFMLDEWDKEYNISKKRIKREMEKAQRDNFDLRKDYVKSNLEKLGIDVEIDTTFDEVKPQETDPLLDRNFNKLSKKVRSQIVRFYNDKDYKGLSDYLTSKGFTDSMVSMVMRIYRTESTQMRSNSMILIQEELERQGIKVKRRWLHTMSNPSNVLSPSYIPREDHLALNGTVEHNGYFTTFEGNMGKGPGMFGVPSEDINCRCDVDFILDE